MAQYKVLQDIEAEDKLLGPLSLRQFLYAVMTVVLGFIMFRLLSVHPLLSLPFLPFAILFAVLAAPFGRDQPSEVWLLAKIRYFLKPRRRIWDQAGLQELVSVTAPKKIEHTYTDGLSQTEVKSRLRALADTIDSRGWAVKGVASNMATNPAYFQQSSDRLFDVNALMPATNPDAEVPVENDPLAAFNPVAQQFSQMVADSDQAHRTQVMQRMQAIRDKQQAEANQPKATAPKQSQQQAYGNTKVLQPAATQASSTNPGQTANPPVTQAHSTARMRLVDNNDLNVATIAHEANRDDGPQDEVVVSLH